MGIGQVRGTRFRVDGANHVIRPHAVHGRLRTKITTGNEIRHRQFFRGHGNAVLLVSIFPDLAPCAMASQSGMSHDGDESRRKVRSLSLNHEHVTPFEWCKQYLGHI
jgi:hypothetical protein